ncbi:MAG: response regulator [Bacteroidetes bacterium]|nr:MAG: response regulator [Bacteroidota bacterium]
MYKIFVIEDNRTEGLLLQLSLSELKNVSIKTFPTGTKMLESLHQDPNIAIVDLNLPDMNGLDLIKQIKNYDPTIRIVVVSAQREIDVLAEVQAQGVYNYLVKSEACLGYLNQVIEDLLVVIAHQKASL